MSLLLNEMSLSAHLLQWHDIRWADMVTYPYMRRDQNQ
jgi:hypothetical protein